jgi:hypothetical protein
MAVKVYGLDDVDPIECMVSPTLKRLVLNKLQAKIVVFNDRIELKCQIPVEANKSADIILTLMLP